MDRGAGDSALRICVGDLSPSIFCCKVAWFRERFSLSSSTPCNLWPREELVLNSLEWESCCWPSPTPALRRAGPEPSLVSKLELTLLGWTQMSQSWEHNSSRADPTHPQMPCGSTGEGKMAPNLDSWANRTAGFRRACLAPHQVQHFGACRWVDPRAWGPEVSQLLVDYYCIGGTSRGQCCSVPSDGDNQKADRLTSPAQTQVQN